MVLPDDWLQGRTLFGGMQAIVENTEPMYRDIRALGSAESYRVRLEGLVRGKEYKVNFNMLTGRLDRFTLYNSAGRLIGTYRPGSFYNFVATGASSTIEIRVAGGTR